MVYIPQCLEAHLFLLTFIFTKAVDLGLHRNSLRWSIPQFEVEFKETDMALYQSYR